MQHDAGTFSTYLYLTDAYRSAPPIGQTHGTKTATLLDDFDTTRALGVEDPRYGQIAAVFHEDSDRVAANNVAPPGAPALAFSGTYERYAYDARGRRVEVTKPALVSPQGGGTPALREVATRTEYDDKDRVSEVIFAFDRATSPTQTADSNVRFRFTYGEDGAREKVVYPSGLERLFSEIEREIVHPPTGRVETLTEDPDTRLPKSISKPEGTIDYGYDEEGALASMSYLGRRVEYERDMSGRIARMNDGTGTWIHVYNSAGLVAQVDDDGADLRETRLYDSLGRIENIRHAQVADDSALLDMDYLLGPDGNRVGIVETSDLRTDRSIAYEYDALGRLVAERYDEKEGADGSFERSITYHYDADGNRVRETRVSDDAPTLVREYHYQGNSQRLDHIDENGDRAETYTWTAKGEMASRTTDEGTRNFEWGPGETLEAVVLEDGMRIEYDYDDSRTLVSRRVVGTEGLVDSEQYLVDVRNDTGYSQVLADIDSNTGAIRRSYAVGRSGVQAEYRPAVTGTGVSMHLVADAIGSARAYHHLDEMEGQQTLILGCSAFGDPLQGEESVIAFAGERKDPSTAMQYHRARWFDPRSSSWVSSDPYPDLAGNRLHPYAYVGQSPTNRRDPSGQASSMAEVFSVLLSEAQIAAAYDFKLSPLVYRLVGIDIYSLGGGPSSDSIDMAQALLYGIAIAMKEGALMLASALPIIGTALDAVDFYHLIRTSVDILRHGGSGYSTTQKVLTFGFLLLFVATAILPFSRLIRHGLRNAFEYLLDLLRPLDVPSHRVLPAGSPSVPVGRISGERINIGGDGEAPGFTDVTVPDDNYRRLSPRVFSETLPDGSASDVFLRFSLMTEGTAAEIDRLSRPGTRITILTSAEDMPEQIATLEARMGAKLKQVVEPRTWVNTRGLPGGSANIGAPMGPLTIVKYEVQ